MARQVPRRGPGISRSLRRRLNLGNARHAEMTAGSLMGCGFVKKEAGLLADIHQQDDGEEQSDAKERRIGALRALRTLVQTAYPSARPVPDTNGGQLRNGKSHDCLEACFGHNVLGRPFKIQIGRQLAL
jgi:hypothetical protein